VIIITSVIGYIFFRYIFALGYDFCVIKRNKLVIRNMRRIRFYFFIIFFVITGSGCGDRSKEAISDQTISNITEQEDGSIILNLKEAYLLQDSLNPEMNTAEWSLIIKNRGRYELWISSFTKDTMDLKYDSPVIVNFGDKKISANPVGNEIVLNAPDTGEIYFRADSKLGSVYVDKPGNYNVQVVSANVRDIRDNGSLAGTMHTQMRSLILKPMTE